MKTNGKITKNNKQHPYNPYICNISTVCRLYQSLFPRAELRDVCLHFVPQSWQEGFEIVWKMKLPGANLGKWSSIIRFPTNVFLSLMWHMWSVRSVLCAFVFCVCMCGYAFGIEVVIRSSPFHGKYDYILHFVLHHQITQAHDRKKSKRCRMECLDQGTGSYRTQRFRPYCCPASISVSGCSSAKAGNSGMPRLKLCMDTTT